MFCVCKIPEQEDRFILFDKEDIDLGEFQLEKEKDIQFEELISEYSKLPILSLNDFVLRTFNSKHRTITHKLGEIHIDCWEQLEHENSLIDLKKSKLSKSLREAVQKRYNEILNV